MRKDHARSRDERLSGWLACGQSDACQTYQAEAPYRQARARGRCGCLEKSPDTPFLADESGVVDVLHYPVCLFQSDDRALCAARRSSRSRPDQSRLLGRTAGDRRVSKYACSSDWRSADAGAIHVYSSAPFRKEASDPLDGSNPPRVADFLCSRGRQKVS